MKKHNEGYVLAYVMVIIAVLMLVASSVMGVALKNLQRQRAEVETMQAKYAAEGAIERILAKVDKVEGATTVHDLFGEGVICTIDEENTKVCYVTLTEVCDSVMVICELQVTSDQAIETIMDNGTVILNLQNPVWKYISYTISTVEDMGGGGDA